MIKNRYELFKEYLNALKTGKSFLLNRDIKCWNIETLDKILLPGGIIFDESGKYRAQKSNPNLVSLLNQENDKMIQSLIYEILLLIMVLDNHALNILNIVKENHLLRKDIKEEIFQGFINIGASGTQEKWIKGIIDISKKIIENKKSNTDDYEKVIKSSKYKWTRNAFLHLYNPAKFSTVISDSDRKKLINYYGDDLYTIQDEDKVIRKIYDDVFWKRHKERLIKELNINERNLPENEKKEIIFKYYFPFYIIDEWKKESRYIIFLNDIMNYKQQVILYGPPGTGKTFIAKRYSTKFIKGEGVMSNNSDFERYRENGQIEFITFHPSYSYEEFIEGISINSEKYINHLKYNEEPEYIIKDGKFKTFCKIALSRLIPDLAQKDLSEIKRMKWREIFQEWKEYKKRMSSDEKEKFDKKDFAENEKFIFIIDEINRGDISKIFGELITLIEDDKRLGCKNEISTTLPYSSDEFGVPPNIFIIGTMNTADRSITLLDVALRRRFAFYEIMPDFDELWIHLKDNSRITNNDKEYIKQCLDDIKLINTRIKSKPYLGKDKQIGHSYFFNAIDKKSIENITKYEIIPLLKEYCYENMNDFNKIIKNTYIEKLESTDE